MEKGGDLIFHLSGQKKNTQLVLKQQNCAFMRMSWLLGPTRSVIVVEHLGVQLLFAWDIRRTQPKLNTQESWPPTLSRRKLDFW